MDVIQQILFDSRLSITLSVSAALLATALLLYPHIAVILLAIIVGLITHFRLPAPDPSRLAVVLGDRSASFPIAHRCAGRDAPENTLAGLRRAHANGVAFVEIDIAVSKDGVAMVLHDDTVDRTTNGSGRVDQLSSSELLNLDATISHPEVPQEPVPKLSEFVATCEQLGVSLLLDVKDYSNRGISAIVDIYREFPWLYNHSILCSFYPQVVYRVRASDPRVITALIHRPHFITRQQSGELWPDLGQFLTWFGDYIDLVVEWCNYTWLPWFCGISAFLAQCDLVSIHYVGFWSQRNVATIAWTVNDRVTKEYLRHVVQAPYITDTLLNEPLLVT